MKTFVVILLPLFAVLATTFAIETEERTNSVATVHGAEDLQTAAGGWGWGGGFGIQPVITIGVVGVGGYGRGWGWGRGGRRFRGGYGGGYGGGWGWGK